MNTSFFGGKVLFCPFLIKKRTDSLYRKNRFYSNISSICLMYFERVAGVIP